jgi:hypothetical protein
MSQDKPKEDTTQERIEDYRRLVDEVVPQQEREIKENERKEKNV